MTNLNTRKMILIDAFNTIGQTIKELCIECKDKQLQELYNKYLVLKDKTDVQLNTLYDIVKQYESITKTIICKENINDLKYDTDAQIISFYNIFNIYVDSTKNFLKNANENKIQTINNMIPQKIKNSHLFILLHIVYKLYQTDTTELQTIDESLNN